MLRKSLFFTGGILCVVLGFIGIFFPVLPTTPFLLLAAFFFMRSSERALQWLLNNRWFGPYIRRYRDGLGMSARDKAFTLLSLWLAIGLTIFFVLDSLWVQLLLIGIAGGVTAHLLRINTYRPEHPQTNARRLAEPE